jgi:hypothetical protein
MLFDVNEAIRQLVKDFEPGTLNRRAILLYQLQTWTYISNKVLVDYAGAIAAARFLELHGAIKTQLTKLPRYSSGCLKASLSDTTYCDIYDTFIQPIQGWTGLLRAGSHLPHIRATLLARQHAQVACDIIDYRFRYLEHGGSIKAEANIDHGKFYVWKLHKESVGNRTINKRWSLLKKSAPFLYVSARHESEILFPSLIVAGKNYQSLQRHAKDVKMFRRILGECAYVIEKLGDRTYADITIPKSVMRLPPKTAPLSTKELVDAATYKSEYMRMRAS